MVVDPKYSFPFIIFLLVSLAALFQNEVPSNKVTSQNYKLFTDTLSCNDLFMKESFDRMIEEKRVKTIKQKIMMERNL